MKKVLICLILFSVILFGCKIEIPLPEEQDEDQTVGEGITSCTDTDNGNNAQVEGTIHVTYPNGDELELTDFCKYADPLNEPDKVVEYFCDNNSETGYNLIEVACDCHNSQTGISVGYCTGEYFGLTI